MVEVEVDSGHTREEFGRNEPIPVRMTLRQSLLVKIETAKTRPVISTFLKNRLKGLQSRRGSASDLSPPLI
jgi:hypothetical protein